PRAEWCLVPAGSRPTRRSDASRRLTLRGDRGQPSSLEPVLPRARSGITITRRVGTAGRGGNRRFYQILGKALPPVLKHFGIPVPHGNPIITPGQAGPEEFERAGESSFEAPDRPSQFPRSLLDRPALETTKDQRRAIVSR